METNLNNGTTVVELDQLIRRALQEHYLELQPPAMAWGSIQHHLNHLQGSVSERKTRELHIYRIQPQPPPDVPTKGRKEN